jgi:hypothetical protein
MPDQDVPLGASGHGVVEGGFADHGLRDAVANFDLAEDRDQGRRIGRCECMNHYLGDADITDWRASPARAKTFAGLPPA